MQIEIDGKKYELKFKHARFPFAKVIKTKPFDKREYRRLVQGHTIAKIYEDRECVICNGSKHKHAAGGWNEAGQYIEGPELADPCPYCKGKGFRKVMHGVGEAWCSAIDNWDYDKGRKVAFTRALQHAATFQPAYNSFSGRQLRRVWWEQYHRRMDEASRIAEERHEAVGADRS